MYIIVRVGYSVEDHLHVVRVSFPPPILPPSSSQDADGKSRVETVRKFEVEERKTRSGSISNSEEDIDLWTANEKVILLSRSTTVKYFEHRHLRYIYNTEAGQYLLLR